MQFYVILLFNNAIKLLYQFGKFVDFDGFLYWQPGYVQIIIFFSVMNMFSLLFMNILSFYFG